MEFRKIKSRPVSIGLLSDEFSTDLGNVLPQAKYDTCGNPTETTDYPFLAAIGYNNSRGNIFYGCDGVLLNRLYVLVQHM
jgi:hypothetical protein